MNESCMHVVVDLGRNDHTFGGKDMYTPLALGHCLADRRKSGYELLHSRGTAKRYESMSTEARAHLPDRPSSLSRMPFALLSALSRGEDA